MLKRSACILCLLLLATIARADSGASYTFQSLYPQFLTTEITPAVWQYESAVSPAAYEPAHGDFLTQFTSPSGKQVSVVVKAPVTTLEYDVPPIANGQSAYQYLNQALYDSSGNPRTATYIKFPAGVYDVDFPLGSSCSSNYVHWQLPSGASDLVIDGQGSTVNFSDFCLGLNLPNVNRVTFKNFTFSWPNLQLATVATIVAVGGNGNTGYTYDVHIDAAHTAHLPNIIAAVNAWDSVNGHWDTADTSNVSYGNGFPAGSGVALSCVETPAEQAVSGCTAKGITSYGVQFEVGQSVLLRHYDYATAISASGNDVTLDQITLQNVIGTGLGYSQGRGLLVTNCVLERMAGQPISAGGNFSLFAGTVGDVVFDNDSFGYSGDDPFDMNTPLIRYTSLQVNNNTNMANNVSTPMNTYTFDASSPGNQLEWPDGDAFAVQTGDTIALFDNGMGFQGVVTAQSVNTSANGTTSVLTLDQQISPALGAAGFIAADLSSSAGARYVIQNSTFLYTSGRALLLQTPFGWVHDNHFAGQTFKQVYVLASQYWGEGTGAQELIIDHNTFDGTGAHQRGFFALDIIAESTNFFSGQFPNVQNEVAGTGSAAPPVNQNIVVADNTFTSDSAVPIVNISSVNDAVFSGNSFSVPSGAGSYPVTIHDASNIVFDKTNQYTSWLSGASCAGSPLLDLSDPSPAVAVVLPNACGIQETVSGLVFEAPDSSSSSSGAGSGSGSGSTGSSGSRGGGGGFDPLAVVCLGLILSLKAGARPR